MFSLIFMMYFIGAIPMYFLIDKRYNDKQEEKYRGRLAKYKAEQADPKYNLTRQKEFVTMINEGKYQDEVIRILGKDKFLEIVMKYNSTDLRWVHHAFIKAVAEREGWEVYYDPIIKNNIYYYGVHVDIEDLI